MIDLFFDNFDILIESPGGIKKLREFILQLAVMGKLVPQDPRDEPASILLEKIKAEKEQLIKEGKIKRQDPLPLIAENEMPYELPKSWKWIQIRDICHDWGQKKPNKDFIYIDVASIDQHKGIVSNNTKHLSHNNAPSRARKIVKKDSILYAIVRPYLLNIAIIDKEYESEPIASTAFVVLHTFSGIFNRFVYYYLRSQPFINYVEKQMIGVAYPAINDAKFFSGLLPLPPLNEQKRIVEKVERLLGLCNELEEKKEKRDQKQVNLNNASLEKLLASSEADEFRKCWSKISENFDILYDSPENVNKLKQAILQLAVMGKLVPQDPRDEPASILLEKIKAEKEQLIKEGKIKRQDPLPLIAENEMPYELPEGWKWVKLAHISNNIHYGYTASADLKINKIKFLRISDIQNNTVNWNTVPGCKINASDLKSYELHNGDLLIARTGGTIGKSYLVEDLKLCSAFASYLIRIIPSSFIYPKYLKYFSGSLLYWKQLYARCTGTGQPNVNGVSLSNLILPISPLNEQKRIVEKVERLLGFCDRLEENLKNAEIKSAKLFDASINHREIG